MNESTRSREDSAGTQARTVAIGKAPAEIAAADPVETREPLWAGGSPPRSGRFLTWRVTIAATGFRGIDVDPLHFEVRMADGRRFAHRTGSFVFAGDDSLQTRSLAAGDRLVGTVTFDVPEGRGELLWIPVSVPLARWDF